MRKLALAIGTLAVLVAGSFVTPVAALAAGPSHSPRVPGPHAGAKLPRSPVHAPSTRVPSTNIFASPVNCDAAYHFVFSPGASGNNVLFSTASLNAGDVWGVGVQTVNGYDQSLAEHWNGAVWSVVASPNQSAFNDDWNAVTAISTGDVWAVGEYWTDATPTAILAIAHHWNGATWTSVAVPQPSSQNYLFGVRALASNNVWAVGTTGNGASFQTLIEHYDGGSWTTSLSANTNTFDNELFDVSAFNGTDVWAVGEQSTSLITPLQSLAEHYDGTTWTAISPPNQGPAGSDNEILGVNALEAGHAVGVGYGNFISGTSVRVSEVWDLVTGGPGTATFQGGPGTGDSAFLGVARAGAGLWAVGYWRNLNSPRQTMVRSATWNSTSHTLAWSSSTGPSEDQSPLGNVLFAVTAIDPYAFWATGYDVSGANVAQTYVELYCAPHFTMTGPAAAPSGSGFSLTVKVQNGDGTIRTGYRGTVTFTSTDISASLPGNYAFVSGDNGVHTFTGFVLRTAGSQSILVADIAMPLTTPAFVRVQVCLGACPSASGVAGSRNANAGPTGVAGGRTGVNQSAAGVPGPRLPAVAPPAETGGNASTAGPETTSELRSSAAAAAPAAASTSTSPESAQAVATSTKPVQAPANRVVTLTAHSEPVSRPPEPTPWSLLLLIPLVVSALALVTLRRRTIKEKSNARI